MIALPGRLVLLGHPVAHSLSPAFQNAALAHARIALQYEALDVGPAELHNVLDALVGERAAGNVTIPHKRAVFERCDRVSEVATRVGAVNTFWVEDGALAGDNTDVAGVESLLRSVGVTDRVHGEVLLIGAGGAASAVLAALERTSARVHVWSRDASRARALAIRFADSATPLASLASLDRDIALVINATPLGRDGPPWPIEIDALPRDTVVLDLAYARGETSWVRRARGAGRIAADGREMLLVQGALAFERWFGVAPDLSVMRRALDDAAATPR